MTNLGYPHGDRPGDTYPPITERPYIKMTSTAESGTVLLTISTPKQIILRVELEYEEMAACFEVLVRALLSRIRQLS